MAKILDSMFFSAVTFLLMFILLSFTGKDVKLCAILALAAAFSVSILVSSLSGKKHIFAFGKRKAYAERFVKNIIYEDAAVGHKKVFSCLEKKYPVTSEGFDGQYLPFLHGDEKEKGILTVVQKLKTSPDDILYLWRTLGKSSGAKSMVIAIPGKSDNDVKIQALKLSKPDAVILDRQKLVSLARKHIKPEAPAKAAKRLRPLQALKGFLLKRKAGKYALYTALFTFNYVITGFKINLIFSFLFAFITMYSMLSAFERENLI